MPANAKVASTATANHLRLAQPVAAPGAKLTPPPWRPGVVVPQQYAGDREERHEGAPDQPRNLGQEALDRPKLQLAVHHPEETRGRRDVGTFVADQRGGVLIETDAVNLAIRPGILPALHSDLPGLPGRTGNVT